MHLNISPVKKSIMEYTKLLDELYEHLPKKIQQTERFEIPVFSSFIEGNQTIVKNINEVADKLRRDQKHIIKYLSKEFAVPTNFDGKRLILNGRFREDALNQRLNTYVSEFVICNECKKPDTSLISFEGVKYKRCEVCGARSPVIQL
jgi:translation initiation factor 2 subunit 2